MKDRRFEPRHPVKDAAELRWEASGVTQECSAILWDISRSGARVESQRPIRVESAVQVLVRNQEVTARVKSCARTATGFVLGLELDVASEGVLMTPRRTPAT